MSATQTDARDVVFPCVPWCIEGDGERIEPKPGTWTLAPENLMRVGVKGIVSCPGCGEAALVRYDMGHDTNGCRFVPHFKCARCKALFNARLLDWDTRKLFCVVFERTLADGSVVPGKEYTHAEHRSDAMFAFMTTNRAPEFRVVEVGQVIGYFGRESDKDQKELTV